MRRERDSLGELEIPAQLPYGARTERNRRNLSVSGATLGEEPAYLAAMVVVKKAAALANREARVLSDADAEAIVGVCDQLLRDAPAEWFPVDLLGGGGSIGVNTNVNEVIAHLASVPVALVNASQSTADVCHTAVRLALRQLGTELARVLDRVALALEGQKRRSGEAVTLARTCLRDAMPVRWDALFDAYTIALRRRAEELDDRFSRLAAVSLGGTVIGSGEGAPAGYRERILPLLGELAGAPVRRRESLYDAAQNSDDLGAVSASLALLAQTLLKLCRDLRLLASGPEAGFRELRLPTVLEGSSFFPGKSNPVVPETVMHAAFQVLGHDRATQAALEHAELQLNVFESAVAYDLFLSIRLFLRCLPAFADECLAKIEIDLDRMAEYEAVSAMRRNDGNATA